MSLDQIRSFDYAILLCDKMAETRAFYRDVMVTMERLGRPSCW